MDCRSLPLMMVAINFHSTFTNIVCYEANIKTTSKNTYFLIQIYIDSTGT